MTANPSLLTRHLDDALQAELSTRQTARGARLDDVIRSGVRLPQSAVGLYAPDAESYQTFRELFQPVLRDLQAQPITGAQNLGCLQPAQVVSTRIRVARNLAGHAFPARMSRAERLAVESKIVRACEAVSLQFPGHVTPLGNLPGEQLNALVASGQAFGPQDEYMTAANIHADWPAGRSVFNAADHQLSIWINEEDHLRVAVVMPGASITACADRMARVLGRLAAHLDFSHSPQHGYLTSCPSNAGSGMRVSYRVHPAPGSAQARQLAQLEAGGRLQVRAAQGEHAATQNGPVDISFRHRVGITAHRMLQDMDKLFMQSIRTARHPAAAVL